MSSNGFLLSFEGSEGCGKSTQIRLLAEHLRAAGQTVEVMREPGGTEVGEEIRHLLQHAKAGHTITPETELLLFAASRAQLVRQKVRPLLAAGVLVILDRFLDSTTVYQGIARGLPVHQVTFVPDAQGQFTSDHGWNFPADAERLRPLIAQAHALGVRVSLFMDADAPAMAAARAVGADRVELYTEPYAAAWGTPAQAAQLQRFADAARAARAAGLGINAGHDLNRDNLTAFLREVPGVQEVSIGHALIADALELGYIAAVQDYLRCVADAHTAA